MVVAFNEQSFEMLRQPDRRRIQHLAVVVVVVNGTATWRMPESWCFSRPTYTGGCPGSSSGVGISPDGMAVARVVSGIELGFRVAHSKHAIAIKLDLLCCVAVYVVLHSLTSFFVGSDAFWRNITDRSHNI
jgi:hypothetical protein